MRNHVRHSKTKFRLLVWTIVVLASFALGLTIVDASKAEAASGGISIEKPTPKVKRMVLTKNGKATVPNHYPKRVRQVIKAANRISNRPYVYGGGHGSFVSSGYDCSGSVSYALRGGRLLSTPLTSGSLAGYGRAGRGRYITIYANASHVFMKVGRLWYDTSGANPSRWQRGSKSLAGYTVRHPKGL